MGKVLDVFVSVEPPFRGGLLFFVANDQYFVTHRLSLAIAAGQQGWRVGLVTLSVGETYQKIIQSQGIEIFTLKHFDRSGLSPWKQYALLKELSAIYSHFSPHIVHHVGIKPIVWGTWIALRLAVPKIINAFGGLGYLFTHTTCKKSRFHKGFLRAIFKRLYYPKCLHQTVTTLVQNEADRQTLKTFFPGLEPVLIPGVGIDTQKFIPAPPEKFFQDSFRFIYVGRLLQEKGLEDLAHALRLLKKQGMALQVDLYGDFDACNPSALSPATLEQWEQEGLMKMWGYHENMVPIYQKCHGVVLPSHREGFPKTLLEAASCGVAIIATDIPGCQSVVVPNITGLLVPPHDPIALCQAMATLALKDRKTLAVMGEKGRHHVQQHFSKTMIHKQMFRLYDQNL